jgi:hypothetical protein
MIGDSDIKNCLTQEYSQEVLLSPPVQPETAAFSSLCSQISSPWQSESS